MPAGSERRFLTTLPFPGREAWASRCERIDPATISSPALLRRLVAEAARHRALIVDGSVGPRDFYLEPLAALAVRRRAGGAQTPIVLVECQWKTGGSRIDRALARLGLRALDGPRVAYCVLTEWERDRFPGTWGVDRGRVFVTPYCHTLSDAELAAPTSTDGDVFAGGNSLRDYGPLVSAATQIGAGVTIATKLLDEPLPGNVTAGPVPKQRFFELLRNARAVVVPLADRHDRTGGQQTYLNAMALGKVTIVTDSPGAREYVENGRTGLVVPPGDADALAEALRWSLDPANAIAVERMTAEAMEVARTRFSPERYVETLLSVAERVADY
jgi:Glycosyl transferases group 1